MALTHDEFYETVGIAVTELARRVGLLLPSADAPGCTKLAQLATEYGEAREAIIRRDRETVAAEERRQQALADHAAKVRAENDASLVAIARAVRAGARPPMHLSHSEIQRAKALLAAEEAALLQGASR